MKNHLNSFQKSNIKILKYNIQAKIKEEGTVRLRKIYLKIYYFHTYSTNTVSFKSSLNVLANMITYNIICPSNLKCSYLKIMKNQELRKMVFTK
jgi:hypothetical protein